MTSDNADAIDLVIQAASFAAFLFSLIAGTALLLSVAAAAVPTAASLTRSPLDVLGEN